MRRLVFLISCMAIFACPTADAQDHTDSSQVRTGVPPQSTPAGISVGEEFSLLYESLKETTGDYNEDVMKTLAFLIITLGWFITSDRSRQFFKKNKMVRVSSIIAVIVICAIHIRASVLSYLTAKQLGSLIGDLNYVAYGHYISHEITPLLLTANLIQNVVLFGVLVVILVTLDKTATNR